MKQDSRIVGNGDLNFANFKMPDKLLYTEKHEYLNEARLPHCGKGRLAFPKLQDAR